VEQRAADAIAHALYHDANGAPLAYALPDYGTFDSLSELSNEALRALHANYFRSARFVVSAAGDVNRDALKEVLDKSRSGETTMGAVAPLVETAPTFAAIPVDAPPLKVKEAQAQGAWIFVAWRTPALSTLPPADTAALRVLSAALADSSRARLQGRLVREKSVMERRNKTRAAEVALQVAAQWTPRRWAGELVLMAQCDTQNMDTVKNALLDEVHRLRTAPLTPLELQAAKNYVRGEWALQHEQPRERAFQGALPAIWNSFADTDWPQYIATVTSEDIRRVTQKYLQAYAVVLILPQP
jgi:predicted Zn-dependent peptidase